MHSTRDPMREAKRIVDVQLSRHGQTSRWHMNAPVTVFLLNPGLGYAAPALLERFPQARLFAIYSSQALLEQSAEHMPSIVRDTGLQLFSCTQDGEFSRLLASLISSLEFLSSSAISWPSAIDVPGHQRLEAEFVAVMHRLQREFSSRSFFGPRWFKNYVQSMSHRTVPLNSQPNPVVLCAAGPSLSDACEHLKKLPSKVEIWALSSCLKFLTSKGIRVNKVICTDGGYWAALHLRSLQAQHHLIAARTANMPQSVLQKAANISHIRLNMAFEALTELPKTREFPASHPGELCLPERGSVIFTALDILGAVGTPMVFLIGADFSYRKGQTHARPHAFDSYVESRGMRVSPLEQLRWERSIGDDLSIYADWLRNQNETDQWPQVFRIARDGRKLPIEECSFARMFEIIESWKFLPQHEHRAPKQGAHIAADHRFIATHQHEIEHATVQRAVSKLEKQSFIKPDRDIAMQTLMYLRGIEVKDAYLEYIIHGDAQKAIRSLQNELTIHRHFPVSTE